MSTYSVNILNLNKLASEKSAESRRIILTQVADLFLDQKPASGTKLHTEFDQVMQSLCEAVSEQLRAQIACKLAFATDGPRGLLLMLATDAIEVATPILQNSVALTDEDLIEIVGRKGAEHASAIAGRRTLSPAVSNAIAKTGDDSALARVLTNAGANIDRQTFEIAALRAEDNLSLQDALVSRHNTPLDLLADLIPVVERVVREQIIARFEKVDERVLEAAMTASHERLLRRFAEEKALDEARQRLSAKRLRRALDGALLVSLLKEKCFDEFLIAFSEIASVTRQTVRRALAHPSPDGVALLCKAAGLRKSEFVTIAILGRHHYADANALEQDLDARFSAAKALARIYDELSPAAAQRAIRFIMARTNVALETAQIPLSA
ncbi:MAG: DUF2336 domain-containing protein [Alphaproteobacteria bacterium]|nr:DUF2336 domain-containing protein [Alphaproteobacteria bacterium]